MSGGFDHCDRVFSSINSDMSHISATHGWTDIKINVILHCVHARAAAYDRVIAHCMHTDVLVLLICILSTVVW